MRKLPLWILLPVVLLSACQSPSQSGDQRRCTPREQDAGQCGRAGSLSSFPELSNIQ